MEGMKYASSILAMTTALALSACTYTGNGGSNTSSARSSVDQSYVEVTSPQPNGVVTSPLTVSGRARGTWYFEASFPVRLLDGNGNEIAIAPAQAQSDWMTTEFVPFIVTLTFAAPSTDEGILVLEKDNPSGLPEHAAEVRIPVRFVP